MASLNSLAGARTPPARTRTKMLNVCSDYNRLQREDQEVMSKKCKEFFAQTFYTISWRSRSRFNPLQLDSSYSASGPARGIIHSKMAGDEPPLERTSRGTSRLLPRIADCNLQFGRLPRETASGGTAAVMPP